MTPERRERKREQERRWHEEHDGPKGVIGYCPPLVPGAVNPMWSITENIESAAKMGASALKAMEPKKQKRKIVASKDGFEIIRIDIEDEEA